MNIVRFQGETLDIYYEFDRDSLPLGEGGMGRIYQGFRIDSSKNIQQIAAIKCIKPELISNPNVIQRGQVEASVQIDHPNLLRMYGFFSGAELSPYSGSYVPMYYIAMERLIGVNLDEVLFKGIVKDKYGLNVKIAEELFSAYTLNRVQATISVICSVLNGLACMHRSGVIHRDMDPSNVMLTQEGFTKIIDFGISKKLGGGSYGGGLTQTGQFLGKLAYAAPELILGDLMNQGPETDIYAVGIMMYQMLTGKLPVSGTDQVVMSAHLNGELDFSGIRDKKLKSIIQKATSKKPEKRYHSAEEFLMAFDQLENPEQPDNRTAQTSQVTQSYTRLSVDSFPRFVIPAACAAGLAVGVVASFLS